VPLGARWVGAVDTGIAGTHRVGSDPWAVVRLGRGRRTGLLLEGEGRGGGDEDWLGILGELAPGGSWDQLMVALPAASTLNSWPKAPAVVVGDEAALAQLNRVKMPG